VPPVQRRASLPSLPAALPPLGRGEKPAGERAGSAHRARRAAVVGGISCRCDVAGVRTAGYR
jgi:hypothetical protein